MFVGCSFCVRSRPVWRSSCVGSCGVRARRLTGGSQRRRIVEVKHKAVDATRAGHGRDTDCARTGDGRASVRLGRIQLSQDGRRRAVGGLATDGKRTRHGLHTDDSPTDGQRAADGQATETSDGRRTGGGRAGIRLLPTFCDIPRWAAAWRTWDGLLTGGRWAAHGLETGGTRTIPPTGGQRASDGRATDGGRGATATDF